MSWGEEYGASGGGGATTLDGLTDVNAPTPAEGDVLIYDGGAGEWVNEKKIGRFTLGKSQLGGGDYIG